MTRQEVAYRLAFRASLLLYGLCFVLGLLSHLGRHGRLPGLELDPLEEGKAFEAAGDLKQAAREWRMASKVAATEVETARVAAELRSKLGDPGGQVDKYLRARDLWPRSVAAHRGLAWAYHQVGREEESQASFRFALQLDPRDPETLGLLGDALIDRNLLAEAERAYREALALEPRSGARHNSLGIACALQGRFEEAVAHFEEAVRLAPDAGYQSNLERARADLASRSGPRP